MPKIVNLFGKVFALPNSQRGSTLGTLKVTVQTCDICLPALGEYVKILRRYTGAKYRLLVSMSHTFLVGMRQMFCTAQTAISKI